MATKGERIRAFQDQSKLQPSKPQEHVLARVLLACILAGKQRQFGSSLNSFRSTAWKTTFSGLWAHMKVKGGKPFTERSFENLLKMSIEPPNEAWGTYLQQLAKMALAELNCVDAQPNDLLTALDVEVKCLDECLDLVCGFADHRQTILNWDIDDVLGSAPFWQAPDWGRNNPPDAAALIPDIHGLISKGETRLIYVCGDAFCAKRDVLKGVIQELRKAPITLPDGVAVPVFARAVGGISLTMFIDQVFNFFCPSQFLREARAHLDIQGKIDVIRAAAMHTPMVLILADIEPFDRDSIVRRLNGDRIGDILAAVIEGNEHSRVLVGVRGDDPALYWSDRAKKYPLKPSRAEFDAAVNKLKGPVRTNIRRIENLSGLAMRFALPIIKHATERLTPIDEPQLIDALMASKHSGTPDAIFNMTWSEGLEEGDKFLIGLIASSHDGLETPTIAKLLDALSKCPGLESRSILDKVLVIGGELPSWQKKQKDLVRARKEVDSRGKAGADSFYVREQLRNFILSRWIDTFPKLARAALWCVSREAFDQARTGIIKSGFDGMEMALVRKMQAISSLVASVDIGQVGEDAEVPAPIDLEHVVIPPLDVAAAMPHPRVAYRFAWSQLYLQDFEAREHSLMNVEDDPLARLDTLLPFLNPQRFWMEKKNRRLCRGDAVKVEDMGPARIALNREEQADVLMAIALAASNVGGKDGFHLVLDAAALARQLAPDWNDRNTRRQFLRIFRAEIDLGLLCGGNPLIKMSAHDPPASSKDSRNIAGVVADIGALTAAVTAANDPWVDGKLQVRLGEAHYLMGETGKAQMAFEAALQTEARLSSIDPLATTTPTVLGGRGIRKYVRLLLYSSLEPERERRFTSDGLIWLSRRPIDAQDPRLVEVRALLNINRTRVGRSRWSDRLGVILDEARLSMSLGDFQNANASIEAAVGHSARGAGFDVLVELAMVRSSLTIERAMEIEDSWHPEKAPERLQALRKHHVALLKMLDAFQTLIKDQGLDPYDAFLEFLRGQADIIESRINPPESEERKAALASAAKRLQDASEHMTATGYLAHVARVNATLDAVKAVIGI